jgi:hypothetical protein
MTDEFRLVPCLSSSSPHRNLRKGISTWEREFLGEGIPEKGNFNLGEGIRKGNFNLGEGIRKGNFNLGEGIRLEREFAIFPTWEREFT